MVTLTGSLVDTSPQRGFTATAQTSQALLLTFLESSLQHAQTVLLVVLERLANEAGGAVRFPRDFGHLATLPSISGSHVFLYDLVDLVDELLPYQVVSDELDLSYSTIASALSYLRRVAQCNSSYLDVDSIEDEVFWLNEATTSQIAIGMSQD